MTESAVPLAALGIVATTVAGIIWLAKYFAKTLAEDLKEHTKASIAAANASKSLEKTVSKVGAQAELSAANSEEQLKFMKKLNGRLETAVIQKVAEQTVTHQTVEHTEQK